MKRVHVFISGKVQGIFFRAFITRNAHFLGIKGWVKNTKYGKIEAIFEGTEDKVLQMLEICNRGPVGSKITRLEYTDEQFKKESAFKIIY